MPFDAEELEEHIQKYEEYKQSLIEEAKTKKEQF